VDNPGDRIIPAGLRKAATHFTCATDGLGVSARPAKLPIDNLGPDDGSEEAEDVFFGTPTSAGVRFRSMLSSELERG